MIVHADACYVIAIIVLNVDVRRSPGHRTRNEVGKATKINEEILELQRPRTGKCILVACTYSPTRLSSRDIECTDECTAEIAKALALRLIGGREALWSS